MSLPAYMYIYDENGQLIKGSCMALGREGAVEIMNSSYGVYQNTCRNTGKLMGSREHNALPCTKRLIRPHHILRLQSAKVSGCKRQ